MEFEVLTLEKGIASIHDLWYTMYISEKEVNENGND